MTVTPARMQQRRRTVAQWAAENPVLALAEIGVATGGAVPIVKVGDGVTAWNNLADLVGPDLTTSDPGKVPVSTVGQVTTLGVDEVAWRPQMARLSADATAINNSTTLVNITGLVVPVVANAVYKVEAFVFYRSSTIADLLIGWTSTATGFSGHWSIDGMTTTTTGAEAAIKRGFTTWGLALSVGGGGVSLDLTTFPRGTFVTAGTAGVLQMQAAQLALDPTNTIIRNLTMLTAQRVA